MAFIYSAFIENSQAAREWLESIGYESKNGYKKKDDIIMTFISCDTGSPFFTSCENLYLSMYIADNDVDCRGSFELFKAVTAMRDDSELGRHYINNHTGRWMRCTVIDLEDEDFPWEDWTEATLEELINHFKK